MKTFYLLSLMLVSPAIFCACSTPSSSSTSYTPSSIILPQNIQKIGLRPIQNKTTFFALEDKLTLRLQEEFTRGGRYPLVPEDQADGVLITEIDRYINEPISYDQNSIVQERKLWVLVNIYFWDKVHDKIIWSEPNLQGVHRYFVENKPGGISEEQARQIVWDKLSRDIYRRTVEGFGSVSGEPNKFVPQSGPAGKGETAK